MHNKPLKPQTQKMASNDNTEEFFKQWFKESIKDEEI